MYSLALNVVISLPILRATGIGASQVRFIQIAARLRGEPRSVRSRSACLSETSSETTGLVVAITVTAVAMVIAAIVIFRSMPPRAIVMATGSEGGTFYDVGERYRAVLASAGVEVRLVPTAGSAENLALLLDPHSGVSVGLVQGGTIGVEASSKLESLGTVFYEPLWLVQKRGLGNNNKGFVDLRGRRISVGPVGSGTRALALELLKRNGI